MRYLLLESQSWAPETSTFLFGGLFVLGGGYGYLHGGHVTLDLFYNRLSPKGKAILDLITSIFVFIFLGVLIWKGWVMARDSLIILERSGSAFAPPLFPIKVAIPIGSSLLMLQVLVKFIRDLRIATGRN
jgi:TRAP-type mannitol/chloroaromatic compound transport system permease small subunit